MPPEVHKPGNSLVFDCDWISVFARGNRSSELPVRNLKLEDLRNGAEESDVRSSNFGPAGTLQCINQIKKTRRLVVNGNLRVTMRSSRAAATLPDRSVTHSARLVSRSTDDDIQRRWSDFN